MRHSQSLPSLPQGDRGQRSFPLSPSGFCGTGSKKCANARVWASRTVGAELTLPPLAKGATRHRMPQAGRREAVQVTTRVERTSNNTEMAEACGRRILGDASWIARVFDAADSSCCRYLYPTEYAMLTTKLTEEIGDPAKHFALDYRECDIEGDGRLSLAEWTSFASAMEQEFGLRACKLAAMRFLGEREAEARICVSNIYMFDGFDADASLRLLMACAKGSRNMLDTVRSALAQHADPNAALVSKQFNGYTPLIFLAMAHNVEGGAVAKAMQALIAVKADVHRECGQMPFGRMVPLRFAALLQNRSALDVLLQHVNVGDRFLWAAGESVEHVMLEEMQKLLCDGGEVCKRISNLASYSTQATVMLRVYASPIVGGKLAASGASSLCNGTYEENLRLGDRADPNGPGKEGVTALMEVVKKGDLDCVKALLVGRASAMQRDSNGATPLHVAAAYVKPDIARALLKANAEPHVVDHAGLTAWMIVGEAFEKPVTEESAADPLKDNPSARRELLELLKPEISLEQLDNLMDEVLAQDDWELLIKEGLPLEGAENASADPEILTRRLRLHESLFFDHRISLYGAYKGRSPQLHLLSLVAELLCRLIRSDPLKGRQKQLTKYLLRATMGPNTEAHCTHIHVPWGTHDNRAAYREELRAVVKEMLGIFADECNNMRQVIESAAPEEVERLTEAALQGAEGEEWPDGDDGDGNEQEHEDGCEDTRVFLERVPNDGHCPAAAALCAMPADQVTVPEEWQRRSRYWQTVQDRNLLRYDPGWAIGIHDGASMCLALLRLGAVRDLAEFSKLRQVDHASMHELLARGYVAYSELCNEPYQNKMKEVALRVANRAGLKLKPPNGIIAAKRHKRLMEKTLDAQIERGKMSWPGLSEEYLALSHSFYILDTVRLSFICCGDTILEQVECLMQVYNEFKNCTVDSDKLCILRQKSGFAAGVGGRGGYADVKLLIYADLGLHEGFDGVQIPLALVGEVQLILQGYMDVKARMHLAYEVDRGSFDHRSNVITVPATQTRRLRGLATQISSSDAAGVANLVKGGGKAVRGF